MKSRAFGGTRRAAAVRVSDVDQYGSWKLKQRIRSGNDGKVAAYTVHFYREAADGTWYDEVRYDSHDTQGREKTLAPHFHMKVRSAFKSDLHAAVEEIKHFIDNHLKSIEEILEK